MRSTIQNGGLWWLAAVPVRRVQAQEDAVAPFLSYEARSYRASRFYKAEPVEQSQRRSVSRINVCLYHRQAMFTESSLDDGSGRLRCQAAPPNVRMKDEANRRESPEPRLSDQSSLKLNRKVLPHAGIDFHHGRQPALRNHEVLMWWSVPKRHGFDVTEYVVERVEVILASFPEQQSFRSYLNHHRTVAADLQSFHVRFGPVGDCRLWRGASEIAADGACRKTSLNGVSDIFSIRRGFPYNCLNGNAANRHV